MNAQGCPVGNGWCTEHQHGSRQCISTPLDISPRCSVWLLQEIPGVEPTIVLDVGQGAELTLDEAGDLSDALRQLRQSLDRGTVVTP